MPQPRLPPPDTGLIVGVFSRQLVPLAERLRARPPDGAPDAVTSAVAGASGPWVVVTKGFTFELMELEPHLDAQQRTQEALFERVKQAADALGYRWQTPVTVGGLELKTVDGRLHISGALSVATAVLKDAAGS